MWWKRKKEEPKPDWRREGIAKLIAFRNRGETFSYLGVTMMVTGHWEIRPSLYGFDMRPCLLCDYVDVHGVLHQASFGLGELATLERENSTQTMKITLTIDAKAESAMKDLAGMTGLSHIENIKRGLAVLQFVTEQERAGKTVLLKDRNGAVEQVALRPLASAERRQ